MSNVGLVSVLLTLNFLMLLGQWWLRRSARLAQSLPPIVPPPLSVSEEDLQSDAITFLSLLQQKGRFVDFLMDDITAYDDTQVGAAARVVHQGCKAVLQEHFAIEPIRGDQEGSSVTIQSTDSPKQYRLVGKVTGHPPFRGVLLHKGWRTSKITLPLRGVGSAIASKRTH